MNYAARNETLVRLGFTDYATYLKSSRWLTLAAAARCRAEDRCQLCNRGGELHVHHRTYDRLGTTEEERDLVALCSRCHEKFHGVRPNGPHQLPSPRPARRRLSESKARKRKPPTPNHLAPLQTDAKIREGREAQADLNAQLRKRARALVKKAKREREAQHRRKPQGGKRM